MSVPEVPGPGTGMKKGPEVPGVPEVPAGLDQVPVIQRAPEVPAGPVELTLFSFDFSTHSTVQGPAWFDT